MGVACSTSGREGKEQEILSLSLKESDNLRHLGIECHIWLELNSGHGTVTGFCEHGFFHPFSCCWILKNESH